MSSNDTEQSMKWTILKNTYPGAMLKSKIAMFIEGKTSSYAANTFPNVVDVVCTESVASCKMGTMF